MKPTFLIDPLTNRNLLTGGELSRDALEAVLKTALQVKQNPCDFHGAFTGKALAMLFEKPSLRTRMTFEIGFAKLGGHPAFVDQQSARIGERELLRDAVKNLERWVDVLVARTYSHATVEEIVSEVDIPVINALSDRFHPCQALADVLTLMEHSHSRSWSEMSLAYVGDGNNVCHSLMLVASVLGFNTTVVTPPGYEPDEDVRSHAERFAAASGAAIKITGDLDAVVGHTAVYTDTWTSMGDESEKEQRMKIFLPYQVTERVMQCASTGLPSGASIFMHCLPAYRGCEVAAEVIDGPNSVVYDQAENRMHAQNALLLHLLSPKGIDESWKEGLKDRVNRSLPMPSIP